ncbi:succinylglutamate desuccinylase/aspartoacylase family protein [Botrimarina hoheduenensis]|uniref:Succinylglutamate desuccinylase / Aspartoacylase family protein n=1 Tax=Botrimarina hoheduenensis TaxID=2528000 RepID=A0A5C5W8N9_9BACT|nr:succinylglutamate desuccinylase/aspartoacylase family protein [Botrimarina hoheduenensis]TWT46399.1 Succinylglutamate desuccinylase / Aspartoacylase family protein [Botrimarina hoheduenensis]
MAGILAAMEETLEKRPAHVWGSVTVPRGKSVEVSLAVSESYSGLTLPIPIFVRRGRKDGPVLLVSATLHGDELNGAGAVRRLIADPNLSLLRGTLLLAPVINLLGFDRHSRYLPDRRDLNRCFPGSRTGSLASRYARIVFEELVGRCDYGIDLHTAALQRTNYPNVRADLSDPRVADLARAFGAEIIVDGQGPEGSLRRESCLAGRPMVILEGGEVWKVEPDFVDYAVRGVKNVLSYLDMIEQPRIEPTNQIEVRRTTWVRADHGGFLDMHVKPGNKVAAGAPVATNTSLAGATIEVLRAPLEGVVLGVTTLPSIAPGDPICHLGVLDPNPQVLRSFPLDSAGENQTEEHLHLLTAADLSTDEHAGDDTTNETA